LAAACRAAVSLFAVAGARADEPMNQYKSYATSATLSTTTP
jgi:hypothetical protein